MRNGDYLVAAKWPYGYSRYSLPADLPLFEGRIFAKLPERGDVAIFKHPVSGVDYVKRVIGLPGDEVVIARGSVFVNGKKLDEPYVGSESIEPWTHLHTVVRAGHCFVLGDNRRRSSDSREFGQVPYENLRGKAMFRFWPVGRIGILD